MAKDREIGIREFKNGASRYIERVENGEVITVTRRGKPVARVIPAEAPGDIPPGIAKLILEGKIRWSGRPPAVPRRRVKLRGKGKTLSDYVIEDRR